MTIRPEATMADLYAVQGKAELVNGEIIVMEPTGFRPNRAASEIFISLYLHERSTGEGYAIADNAGFEVDLLHRKSFSPDAAWYTGRPTGMKFLEGAPLFAVEVRSEHDYGPAAEEAMAEKRADYFDAGTLCVWDVDLLSDEVVRAWHAGSPHEPIIFRRGDIADAGAAVPGWSMPVDALFVDEGRASS
jgi:Uma2 family endonuclease